jgi:hypothetical protein
VEAAGLLFGRALTPFSPAAFLDLSWHRKTAALASVPAPILSKPKVPIWLSARGDDAIFDFLLRDVSKIFLPSCYAFKFV